MSYWSQPGRWRVAPWNFHPDLRGSLPQPGTKAIAVIDSTLRSIVTSEAGTAATVEDLVEIAWALADAGLTELVFNVIHGGEVSQLTVDVAKRVLAEGCPIATSTELHVAPDTWRDQVDFGLSLGLSGLQWAYGAGRTIAGYSGSERALDLLEEGAEYVRAQGQVLSLAYNVHHTDDPNFILAFFRRAAELGLHSLRIYDTTTSMSPEGMRWLVGEIKEACGRNAPPLAVHTHNSWGLATACTISAVLAGADSVDLVVNGLGTKGGHTPLAETVVALEALYGFRTGIDLGKLTALSELVAEKVGVPLSRGLSSVGPDFFLVEQAGLVMQAYRERDTGVEYDVPWAPSLVGQQRRIVWGRNTVKEPLIAYALQQVGHEPTPQRVGEARTVILAALAARRSYPVWLQEEEVLDLLRAL